MIDSFDTFDQTYDTEKLLLLPVLMTMRMS